MGLKGINSSMERVFRRYGGRIAEVNFSASPGGRRSWTRGRVTSTLPTPVTIDRVGG
jgi:hypothetical protein